jgi:Tol biopolymer transport system component
MNIRTCVSFVVLILLSSSITNAQIEITKTERLDLGTQEQWDYPRFSPDGSAIYYTTESYDGIWSYSKATGEIRQITADPKSGYGFAFSRDGNQIAYRRSAFDEQTRRRTQEVVITDLRTGQSSVVASGRAVSLPTFGSESLIYSNGSTTHGLSKANVPETALLGLENTKIAISKNGTKMLLDPFGDGRYIWPALSPDGKSIVAYEMGRGTVVMTIDGDLAARLGKRNAPTWTRHGQWIVYMDDRDDGHQILSSDLFCVSVDGSTTVQLTSTDGITELFPQCSPSDNTIVTSSLEGYVYVLTYREVTP